MCTFDVVGVNFELGFGVGGRAAVKQHGLHRLHRVGQLRIARDSDLAQIGSGRGASEDRAHDLRRGCFGFGVGDSGNDLEILSATANLHSAQFEIRAFMQRHIQFNAAIIAADVEHMDCGGCAFANGNIKLVDGSSVLQDRTREVAACRHDDAFRRSQWPRGLHSGNVAVAPCVVVPRGGRPIQAASSL